MSSEPATRTTEWRGQAPSGHEIHVVRQMPGPWRVVYGGFSRSSSLRLVSAIAEAAGVSPSTEWVQAVAHRISTQDANA